MNILIQQKWTEGFLDYYRGPNEYRLKVLACRNLERLEGVYFVRPFSPRLVLNYLREVGLLAVLKKVKSRWRERFRNEKYISCGVAAVLEQAEGGRFTRGAIVGFIATLHPALTERIVLPEALIFELDQTSTPIVLPETVLYHPVSIEEHGRVGQAWWTELAGWSNYSGRALSVESMTKAFKEARTLIRTTDWAQARSFPVAGERVVAERRESGMHQRAVSSGKRAVLFGYGHYAKTNVLPNLHSAISVEAIHEIDPTQISYDRTDSRWDTASVVRAAERYDAFFIASFHHTHAPLAIEALKQGAYAVVEKPIITTSEQLTQLLEALQRSPGRLFSGFHRRYSVFNQWIRTDLGATTPIQPISYHCVVYEAPQPPLYWYNWPNSRSHLVTNGCHWLDHFLFLNDFSAPVRSEAYRAKSGAIQVAVELANKAFFTMTLTTRGASYIGFRDYLELTTDNATAKIFNYADYLSENNTGVVRRARIRKVDHYGLMYRSISEKICNGDRGDSLESVKVSGELLLQLEAKLNQQA